MSDMLESPSGAPLLLDRQASMTGASIPAASTATFTLSTVAGARPNAAITGSPTTALQAGLVLGGFRCTGDDAVTVTIGNVTAGPIVPNNYFFDLAVFNP